MLITLHCGGMPFDGTTIESKSLGGSESAAYYMARELARQGHKVTLFTNTTEESESDGVHYTPMGTASEQYPLGEMFHYFATYTPTDVMIIQRHPMAFAYEWASKVNLWWIHDLALYRNAPLVQNQMKNIDGVLAVSEWHKKQVCEVYGLNEEIVYPITNGVDLSLYESKVTARPNSFPNDESDQIKLLYTSRPERGLENLVKPNGIMERLYEIDKNYHLYVCAYDNVTPAMRGYYNSLYTRVEQLPNVTNLGALTKQELADVQRQCDLHVYPSTFEETSCITAMECMAAGLPMLASRVGALPETVEGSGVVHVPLLDGSVDIDMFIEVIISRSSKASDNFSSWQLERAPYYSWENAAARLEFAIECCFKDAKVSGASVVKELIKNSDYYATQHLCLAEKDSNIMAAQYKELAECYDFTSAAVWDEHYATYYQYEKDRGVNYGPENLDNNHRYMHVASLVSALPNGSTVVDYGCAHGHYTVNLAKENPEINFIGIDITESNVEKARAWARNENCTNTEFIVARVEGGSINSKPVEGSDHSLGFNLKADCIIAAEVLEHVADPAGHVNTLQQYLADDGLMIVTTPYGPWEAQGFKEHWPWRAHVHHFEREDLADLWGGNKEFNVVNVPSGPSSLGGVLGSYITTWKNTRQDSGAIDYDRKLALVVPHQTVSCCMIVKDAASSIRRCLESVMPYVDELIISFDPECEHDTHIIVDSYIKSNWPEKAVTIFEGESPLEIGFDAARNATIEKASGDWIFWIDADEHLHDGHNLVKYLRNNQYNGYAIKQHHFSMQPVGVLKTDLPVRLFRNHKGIKFFGVVHEHPEQELNEGVGYATTIDDLSILHDGYKDEATRRGRFSRNVNLLLRDREENPERVLGKFLWLRDLAQMSQWELEDNGGNVTSVMLRRADEGIALWLELLNDNQSRVVIDSLEYYSALARIKGGGFEMDVRLDTNDKGQAHAEEMHPIRAYFSKREHAKQLLDMVFDGRTENYGGKYQ